MTSTPTPASEGPEPFEARLERLSRLVEELEEGDLPLEASIQRFEKGRELHRSLVRELEGFEKRIERLVASRDGADRLEPSPEGGV